MPEITQKKCVICDQSLDKDKQLGLEIDEENNFCAVCLPKQKVKEKESEEN